MIRYSPTLVAVLVAAAPLCASATVFFSDYFSGASTINSVTPAAPTTNSTAYQLSSSKTWVPAPSLTNGKLQYGIASTTSGGIEVQALFTTNPVSLVQVGDYIQLIVTFTNNTALQTANFLFGFGLYNGSQVAPVAGGINGTALMANNDNVTGGVQNWQGYWGQRGFTGQNSRIVLRTAQTTGTDNRNQNLTSTGSGSQSYGSPAGSTVGAQSTAPSGALVVGNTYTVLLKIELTAPNTLAITNTYYNGPDTNGTVLSVFGGVASGASYLTSAFDGLAIGWRAGAATTGGTIIDISSIKVEGEVTVISGPPDITLQPVPVSVPNGGSSAFFVGAQGFNVTYQWHRFGTNLVNGGNISGATSDMLVISPAGAGDVASGLNGYYVTVSGAGGFSTNSTTNSLTLVAGKNLTWAGPGDDWDLNTSANWVDPVNPSTFNFGDTVKFDGGTPTGVVLTGRYLSASSVTVEGSTGYALSGTGSFAGPGNLLFTGTFLDIGNVNTYSGGTIISNTAAYLYLRNYNGLGTGPITLAKAGGIMEVVPTGSASLGINGNIVVADDFTIQFDGAGSFAGVIFGNLSGTAGKTLTLSPDGDSITNRYRVYGANTVMDANIVLNGAATTEANYFGTTLAPYNGSGSQTYNGIISGNGGIIQRAGGTTVLSGQNTYTGGTTPTTGTIGFGADSTPTSGTVTSGPIGTGPLFLAPELPNTTGSAAVQAFGGARTIANPLQHASATNNQTLVISGTNNLTFAGPYTLNGNDGLGTFTNRIWQVDNTALTRISGIISDNGQNFGLIKTGSGTLTLDANNTYTGRTAISNGTLRVNGQISGPVTVATNGTLGGSGTILGAVTQIAGGIIAPGNSIDTLTINNDLSLSGNLNIEVNTSAGTTADRINVSGSLANSGSGTVTVTNLGPALTAGATFALFNKAVTGGNTMTVTGAQMIWTNKLAVDGTIQVLSPVATSPTNISFSLSGNSLTLSWPANYLGWSLQSNAVSIVSSANWFTVPGSASTTQVVVPVNPARSNVFYRMVAP